MAFDPAPGEARWRWTGDGPGYSSPMAITRGGRRQVVVQMQKRCIGVDARDGKLLWSLPFTTAFDQNIFTPVVAGERLVFGGVRQPTFAVTLRQEGDAWKAERAWETNQATFYMNTPVLSGGRLYGFSERQGGQLVALDAATGQLQWSGDASLATNAQCWTRGSVALVLTTDADLFVLKKEGAALAQVARYHVAESPTWATPRHRRPPDPGEGSDGGDGVEGAGVEASGISSCSLSPPVAPGAASGRPDMLNRVPFARRVAALVAFLAATMASASAPLARRRRDRSGRSGGAPPGRGVEGGRAGREVRRAGIEGALAGAGRDRLLRADGRRAGGSS